MNQLRTLKRCFREPIPEIFDAARYLDAGVSAHLAGHTQLAAELFALANNQEVWRWTDSVWGKGSPHVVVIKSTAKAPGEKVTLRMPTTEQKAQLLKRDGFHCRYCGIPVVRAEIRKKLAKLYPESVLWGTTNASQHAALQCLWAQYDHVVPHSYGGTNELDNLVLSCAACNFGKMEYSLEEVGLLDPRDFPPARSMWDGLERVMVGAFA